MGTEQCALVDVNSYGEGGSASSPLVTEEITMGLCICVKVTEWYSIHFGYYFYDFWVIIFGELSITRETSEEV